MFDAVAKNTVVPLVLRFALAVIFIYHGSHKVNSEHDWGASWMPKPPPGQENAQAAPSAAVQLAVAWGELIGGIALVLGFLTRLAALGIIAIMAGAVATVHWPKGFSLQSGGYEYNFAIIALCVALILIGPGTLAVDRFFHIKRKK
jgi:putative oxidoreductase